MRNKKLIICFVIISLLIAIASFTGCKGQSSSTHSDSVTLVTNTAPKNAIIVIIECYNFHPKDITIKVGDTVTWINKDYYNHTVTEKSGVFDSGNIASTKKFSLAFNKEGVYEYFSKKNTLQKGSITVTK